MTNRYRIVILAVGIALCAWWCAIPTRAQVQPSPTIRIVQPDSRAAHAALRQVLERREFRTLQGKDPASWPQVHRFLLPVLRWFQHLVNPFKAFLRRFGRWLADQMPDISVRTPGFVSKIGLGIRYLIYIVLAAAVLVVLGLLLKRLVLKKLDTEDELADIAADAATRRKNEPSFWERSLQEAEALWQAGNQRDALRMLYRACLVLLDARGVLRFDESRANGELLRELRRQGAKNVHETLTPIVRCFDRSWYGFLTVSVQEFQDVVESSHRFREAVMEKHDA